MFNSGILDVAIGIVFVYLLVSLIVSAANELIAAIFKTRGWVLWRGLCNLLPAAKSGKNIAKQVYDHPLIGGLSRANLPSYIPSRTFALALLDVVSGGTGRIAKLKPLEAKIELLPDDVARPLRLLLDESKDDLDRFKSNIAHRLRRHSRRSVLVRSPQPFCEYPRRREGAGRKTEGSQGGPAPGESGCGHWSVGTTRKENHHGKKETRFSSQASAQSQGSA